MQGDSEIPGLPVDFADALRSTTNTDDTFHLARAPAEEDSFYDFASHQLFFDPAGLRRRLHADKDPRSHDIVLKSIETIIGDYELGFGPEQDVRVAQVLPIGMRIFDFGLKIGRDYLDRGDWSTDEEFAYTIALGCADFVFLNWGYLQDIRLHEFDIVESIVEVILRRIELAGYYSWKNPPLAGIAGLRYYEYMEALLVDLADVRRRIHVLYANEGAGDAGPAPYFDPALHQSVNFGLRIVFRQQWKCVGNQYGDIVRTVPLGPKQTQRVSMRHMRRSKTTRSMESTSSSERSEESSSTLKDSSDIVQEASNSLKLYADQEMQGGFNCGLWNAGGSTAFGGQYESANLSRSAKSRISEAMQGAAAKSRQETTVTVSTERESQFESELSAELVNPNDEVAITYVYQKLLRQYLTSTYLAEVESVVFIAENVPADSEITDDWIRANAAAIKAVLLEPSLSDALDAIVNFSDGADSAAEGSGYVTDLAAMLAASATALGFEADGNSSLNFEVAIDAYRSVLNDSHSLAAQHNSRLLKAKSLRKHVRANIMHYMRSIWVREDPDTRLWRYRGLLVPTNFNFVVDEDSELVPLSDNAVGAEGTWMFDSDLGSWEPAADLIDPVGPVGFYGNYVAYRLNPRYAMTKLNELFEYHKQAFSTPARHVVSTIQSDSGIDLRAESGYPHRARYGTYLLETDSGPLNVVHPSPASVSAQRVTSVDTVTPVSVEYLATTDEGTQQHFLVDESIVVTLSYHISETEIGNAIPSQLSLGGRFRIDVFAPEIRDPELDEIEQRHPTISGPGSAEAFATRFTDAVIRDMYKYLPGLQALWSELGEAAAAHDPSDSGMSPTGGQSPDSEPTTIWSLSSALQRDLLARFYHEYLLRRANSRFVVVDTNNIVLNIHTGSGSALEPFKRAHRYLDVAKAGLDIDRRSQMLRESDRSDPDVDQLIVIQGEPLDGSPRQTTEVAENPPETRS